MALIERSGDSPWMSRAATRCRDAIFDKHRGHWRYAFRVATLAWLAALLLSACMAWAFGFTDESDLANSWAGIAFLALVAAPLLENLLTILIVEITGVFEGRLRNGVAVTLCACFAAVTHGTWNLSHALAAALFFATMTYTYLDWPELRFSTRFALTVVQHAWCNLLTLGVFVIERSL